MLNNSSFQKNNLASSANPYLLLHGQQLIHWQEWSENVFHYAQKVNKPILISSGYSACHWCHVMNKNNFENPEIADLMNQHFVCIKIDRETLPDIDAQYMEVLQSITGQGGWPLHLFLLPDGTPIYGGTYFPPTTHQQLPSWKSVLLNIAHTFQQKPDLLKEQGLKIAAFINQKNQVFTQSESENYSETSQTILNKMSASFYQYFDAENGGFGRSQKFPNFPALLWLIRQFYFDQNNTQIKNMLDLTFANIVQGGIYDHIEGGVFRYCVDAQWQIPHFEKMLYDQALFMWSLAEYFLITKNPLIKLKLIQSADFVIEKFTNNQSCFYTAFDADSDGIEGAYYTLTFSEAKQFLSNVEINLIQPYFNWQETGNWEHTNHHYCHKDSELTPPIQFIIDKIKLQRKSTSFPAIDKKILVAHNALMVIALAKTYIATQEMKYLEFAIQTADYLIKNFIQEDRVLHGALPNNEYIYTEVLENYAFLAWMNIEIYELTAQNKYLHLAKQIFSLAETNFYTNKFLFKHATQSVPGLPSENFVLQDSPLFCGHSVMLWIQLYLSHTDPTLENNAHSFLLNVAKSLSLTQDLCTKHAPFYAGWGLAHQYHNVGFISLKIMNDLDPQKALQAKSKGIPNLKIEYISTGLLTQKYQLCHHNNCYPEQTNFERIIKDL